LLTVKLLYRIEIVFATYFRVQWLKIAFIANCTMTADHLRCGGV